MPEKQISLLGVLLELVRLMLLGLSEENFVDSAWYLVFVGVVNSLDDNNVFDSV